MTSPCEATHVLKTLSGFVSLALLLGVGGASAGADGIGDPYYPQDGNGGYQVSHYDVALSYDPARADYLVGETTVSAVATQGLNRFDLDLEGFNVASVTVNGLPVKAFERRDEHELVITPGESLRRGQQFNVRVRYSGTPGLFWMTADDAGAVHAFGEPRSASSWYPVNDHPSDKATFHLAATVPRGWTAIGSGSPGRTTRHGGKTTFEYNETRPVASYLTGLVIDRMAVHRSVLTDGTPVIDAYLPGAETSKPSEDRLPEILNFLTSTFGPYPFSSAGGIFYPGDTGGGFELQQRPVYPGGISTDQFTVIVHENAHQWFGNSVSMRDWRDICIKECFASYAEWLWNEAKEGHNLDADYRATIDKKKNDASFWKEPLYDPGPFSYGGAYTVGPLMLHALRRTVGDDVFFRTLRDWLHIHRYANASWPEFERLAGKESGTDLTRFFQAWAHSTSVPADQYLYPRSLKN